MKDLIKIQNHAGQNVVSAKELHKFLEVKRAFHKWSKEMFAYGFESGLDFRPILAESMGGRPLTDYVLTMDTAKEISMLQRTERGKFVRRYFIECEKQLKDQVHNKNGEYRLKSRLYDIFLIRKGLSKEAAFIRYQLRNAEKDSAILCYPVFVQSSLFTA
ncbi:antA/AntB antirepressor family protein [Chitinophaga polysaccharea]|uniref:antA/AntB antirepressor family protein n=1 Tax=Chitinophaga polysaccharea TaxID=1293035 RepID=UPI00115953D7|nr:antA/AntB antirepressor family protein [Chitinophaga polysaccharea]